LWCELIEDSADSVPQIVDCAFGGLSQQGLELGEHHLDRIEVWRVGRQVKQLCADRFDDRAHAADCQAPFWCEKADSIKSTA
jgi:hypothetical protein